MPEYRLPDNRTLQVPDDTPPEEWQKIQNSLAELYPDHYQPYKAEAERTFLGGLAQAPQALPRGFLNTALLSAIGYAEKVDYGEDAKFTADLKNLKAYLNGDPSADAQQARLTKNSLLTKFAPPIGLSSKLADYALDKFGFEDRKSALDPTILDPEGAYRGSLYQSVPEGLGSAAIFLGATVIHPSLGGALAVGTGVGTQAELQDQARARGEEISLSQEIKSKILGGVIGLSEVLNPLRILKIFRGVPKGDPRPIVQHIKNSLISAGIEGPQEMLAGYFQELVAQGIYDPTLEVGESMADDFTVGSIVGAIVGGGSSAAHHQIHKNQGNDHALSQANEYDKQEQEQDEITRQKVILAEQQGDQIIDPALVPDPFVGPVPDEVKPEGVEIPVLESFDFVPNDDGSVNVIGKETRQSIGTFSNIEEAARAATEKTKQNRNQFVVGSAEQITGINGLAGNGTASNIARKLYNPLNTLIDAKVLANFDVRVSNKRQQQFKKEQEIAKNEEAGQRKLASELMGNIDTTGLSIEELGQMQQELARELSNIQTAYPIEGNVVAPESTLGLFWEYAEKSGIGAKNFYTVKEAKKLLNKADFNQLMSEKSNIKFKKIEATGEIKPVKRIKDRLDISKKSFDDAFKSKNIEVDFKSPAFKYLAETFTGDTNLDSMGKGQKEMLLSHIKSLPRFNNKTKLPDYTPRPYTEEQINAFYNQYKGSQFTNKDIKLGVKNNATGKDLTPKQINQLRIDLLDSGRAKKDKNRLRMTDDFTLQQARKAESYTNETTDEFRNRLRRTTLLTTEEIDIAVNDDAIYKQGVVDASDILALPSPEPIEKYSNLFKLIQQRLVDRNLGDIGVAFNNKLKPSLNIRQKGDKYFYEPVDLDKSKGKPTAVYDRPLKKIIASLEAIDPDGTMSESELATALVNIMDHETYHALIQLGIIKQSEHDIMFKDAKKLLPIDFQKELVKSYRGVKLDAKGKEKEISNADLKKELGPDLEEEFAAEFLRISINNPSKLISPKSKTIINKIINFLTTLGQTIYDAGFTSSRTIIRDIESGKIGARERGQIRNFQQVRKRNLKKYGIARPDASQLDIDRLSKYADIPSFSRQERETLQKEINKLSNQINQKNRRYDLDYAYIGNKTARNDLNEIAFLEKKRDIAKEKLRSLNPVPLDYPSFSRIQPIQLDKVTSTRITARVEDQEIELHYAGKDKVFKEHRVDENTGEGYFNWNVYVKPISRNSPMRESIRWLLQSVKVRGYENQKTGKKKKWKKTDSLQDVADFLNKENGDTENDSGYLSIDDDLVGDITIKEDKDQRNVYTGLLNIELEDRAKGKGIGQAVVEMVASTNPAIVNGEKQLEIYDITPQGRPFWEAIGTEFNRDRIKKASIKLSYLDGKIGFAKDQPSFSRASTDTSPAYMDFSREQIAEESTMDVHFYPNYPTEVPLTWVARINIDDFLYMTTSNDAEIQEIAEEGVMTVSEAVQIMEQGLPVKRKRVQPKFDPEIFDEGTIGLLPRLSIDQNGKVTSHEGRHRIALAKKEGAITTPVFFKMRRNDMRNLLRGEFFKDKNLSNAALQDLGIYNLKSQFRESAVQRGVLDISGLITAPVVRGDTQTMETLRQTQLDFATQVAQGPDVKAPTNNPPINLPQDQPSFSRAGLNPRDLIYIDGVIEEQVYKVWRDNNMNPTAKDLRELFKILAPQSKRKHKFVDFVQLKREVRRAAKKGYEINWYAAWAANVPHIVGPSNMHEFSGVFGITSAQPKPEKNFKDTLRTMIIARKHSPELHPKKFRSELLRAGVSMGNKGRIDAIEDFYKVGIFERKGSSQKTITYALEILAQSKGEFTPFMVIDRHMLKKFGLDENLEKATEIEYRMLQTLNALLSAENYVIDGQVRKFNPPEIQALLWADQRYTGPTASQITNEGNYQAAEKYAEQEVSEIDKMQEEGTFNKNNSFAGHFIQRPRYSSNKQSDIFDTDLGQTMYQSFVNLSPQIMIEFKSGRKRGYLPDKLSQPISFDRWNKFQNDQLEAITSGNKLKFLLKLGIPHTISRSAGTWEGDVNPNIIIHLPNVDSNTIENITAVLLDALMQDSAVIAIPTGRGVRKTQMIITKPQNARFNLNELQDVLNRLSQVERIVKYADGDKKEPLNFTVSATKKSGIIIIDPKQFSGDPYTREDQREFVNLVQPVLTTSGYKLEKYGQESELIEYGEDSSNSTGTRGRIRELGSQVGFIGSSDLQRTAIRDLYQPLYKEYKKLANEIGFIPKSIPPYLEENSALNGLLDFNAKDIAETEAELESYLDSLPPSRMSRWNPAANPISLRIAFDYQEGIEPIAITDAPSYSRSEKIIPEKYKDIDETINGDNNTPDETFADAIIDIAETTEEVGSFLSRMRAHIIDDMSIPEKTLIKLGKASAKIRELNSRAITGAIQMLRWSKKSRGIMSQMMLRGVPVLVDEQGNPVPKGTKGFGGTKVLDFKHGGFVKIMGQLHTTEYGEDLMRLFKMYRIGLRGTRLDAEGKEVVLTPEQLKLAKEIGQDFPIIKMVSDQYNEYNNAVLDYAVQTGILSEEITINQLIKNITTSTKIKENELRKKQIEAEKNGLTDEQFLEQLLDLAAEQNINLPVGKKIETRGTAQIWKENADYYPFYRKMADDTIQGPSVAGGFLSGNPLKIEIKGSKKAIEPEPLEVMARNMQSIVTAAMKNEGLSRLMAIYEEGGIAKKILLKDKKEAKDLGSDVIDVFENGETVHYQVADPIFTYGLQALGMTQDASAFMKVIGLPANVLRESITREPGFIIKNMLRDTLSASVTSGADYIPIIDTFKGFAADLSELERFGIIGGYDAANDRQDIVKKINKIKREQGLDVYDEDGNFAIEQVVKFWDLMGGLTTRSDGSTRKAVADSILELTGDQVEAAYQGLEIINFDRRGFNPYVRIVTTAIPFLNARFQGIDVLYRSATGQYSSKISEIARDSTPEETAKSIILTHAFRGGLLMLLTGLYYALMGDDEKYKEERQSVRDDNWLIPIYKDLPSFKFPVPFEVGFMYKTVPERILDYSMTKLENPNYGNTTGKQLEESIRRGFTTTLKLDPIAWQLWKPIMEVRANKSGFTGNPIVPPFMEKGLDPQEQYNINTSSFAVGFGKAFNVSPIKVDYILKGYTGTLGTYVLDMSDIAVRQATGREYVAPHLTQLPIVKSLFASPIGGGLQEQYYEMRTYSNRVIQTINDLEKKGRKDELVAYMQSHKGALSTRKEVLRIDRFMEEYRKTKMLVQLNETLSPKEKKEIIEQLDRSRNLRLAIVPLLVKRTDQPTYLTGVIRN